MSVAVQSQTEEFKSQYVTGTMEVVNGGKVWLTFRIGSRGKLFSGYVADIETAREYLRRKDSEEFSWQVAMKNRREERAKQRREEREKFIASLVPGMLFHGSWGYDQTNCELAEFIRIEGKYAICKPVAVEQKNDSGYSSMSANLVPIKNGYKGNDTFKLFITSWGLRKSDHCTLTPASWDRSYYSSWYA